MNSIKFLGASGTVTGSNFLLKPDNGKGIIVDMGMFQGPHEVADLNYLPLEFSARDVSAVVVTHAHLDHVGRLPLLVKAGFTGPLYMTEATRVLTELTLLDAAHITAEDEVHPPLYTESDVLRILSQMEIVKYGETFDAGPYKVTLRDAGHILGSATAEIYDPKDPHFKRIVFSGDLGNSPEDIVRPTEMIDKADIVVMESTYGDRTHANEDPYQIMQEEINAIEESGGTLLIPSFSLERCQEILHIIDHLKWDKRVSDETLVYLDSPMAIRATRVYKQFRNLYGGEMARHAKTDDPFNFPGLFMVEHARESRKIADTKGPKVIIAGSGMMTGGRILGHAKHYLPMASTRLLFVGFQAEETLGREILEGARNIVIDQTEIKINAQIRKSSGMSAHADQPQLINWLKHIKGVNKVFLVHGEELQRQALSQIIQSQLNIKNVILPAMNHIEKLV